MLESNIFVKELEKTHLISRTGFAILRGKIHTEMLKSEPPLLLYHKTAHCTISLLKYAQERDFSNAVNKY